MSERIPGFVTICLTMVTSISLAGEIRIRAVSLSSGYLTGEVLVQDAAGKERSTKIEVKSFLNHEVETIDFKSRALVFTKGGEASKEGEETHVLGSIEIPEKLESGVLIFRSGKKDVAPEVIITDDSASVFPAGSTKVLNLTADPMKIELEGKAFECEADSETVIKDQPVQKNNSSGMRAFHKKGDEWVQVKTGSWPHPGKKRVLRVIMINPITKQVELHGIRDISDPSD